MHPVRGFLAVCVLVVLLSPAFAQEKAADLLVGKWEAKEKVGEKEITFTIEFTKDNKVKISFEGTNMEGTYKLNSDTEIEITMTFMGETRTEKSTVSVSKETLEVKSKQGRATKFSRAK